MATKTALGTQLAVVAGFENPKVSLEQYPTPPDLTTHLAHLADLRGDIKSTAVPDLGSGTGMLRLGAMLRSPVRVVGIEFDDDALATVTGNVRWVGTSASIDWIRAGTTYLPFCLPDDRQATVLMSPPFGAQRGNEYADRVFLDPVASVADVPCSAHNEGSKKFIESLVTDTGGDLIDAFRATSGLDRQLDFRDEDRRQLGAEVFRTEWRADGHAADRSPHEPPAGTA